MNVYEKLNAVQVKLNAPKGQYNSFGKYKYRSCEDILEAVKPLLKEVKAIITISDKLDTINGQLYLIAKARFIDCETGDSVECESVAMHAKEKKGMDEAQVSGATSSYARKYCLNGLLLCDDSKDFDTEELHNQREAKSGYKYANPPKQAPKTAPQERSADVVNKELESLGISIEGVAKWRKKDVLELTIQDLEDAIAAKKENLAKVGK